MRVLKRRQWPQADTKQMIVRVCAAACAAICLGGPGSVTANPVGLSSPTPGVSFSGVGTSNVTITSSALRSVVNAQGFDIGANESTSVLQAANAAMFVRIGSLNPTNILGNLTAAGTLVLLNPNGVFFGPGAQVNVNGLIASSLNLTDSDFLNGRYAFQGATANGMVRNEGQIAGGPLGVYLLAPNVTNNGVITSPGGHVALAAGTTAYVSDRADGRGFLVEVRAPAGEALNLGSLTANGGQVSMMGQLVTQSGLVQANTVQKQNGVIKLVASDQARLSSGSRTIADGGEVSVSGRIIEQQGLVQSTGTPAQSGRVELIATEQVNFRAGSQTIVSGGAGEVIDGGTIAAMATNPVNGTVTIESGAALDLSGGALGGHGGELWLGGVSVPTSPAFIGTANAGFDAGILRTVPRTRTVTAADLTGGTARSYLNFYAMDDLTVSIPSTSAFNLATARSITPALDGTTARAGTLRFFAGNNLIVTPATLQNGSRTPVTSTNTVNPWNLVGLAGNDIVFQTPSTQTSVWSTGKGSITLQAGRDIKLVHDGGGGNTTIQTFEGDIALTAGRDIIAPSALNGTQYSGIRLDRVVVNVSDPAAGAGNLYLTAGRHFTGARVNGVETGPGFVLSNGTARVRVGGDLGSASDYATFTVGSAGTLLGATAPIAGSQTAVTLDVAAQGNLYIGNVQDRGASEGLRSLNKFSTVNQASAASFLSATGDIHLRGSVDNNTDPSSRLLPTFTAAAPNGNLFIDNMMQFWSSPIGALSLSAGQSILGNPSHGSGLLLCPDGSCSPITVPASQTVSPITLTAGGDIRNLNLSLVDSYLKTVTISAGGNIQNVSGRFAVPSYGRDSAGNVIVLGLDVAGNQIPATMPAVSIAALGSIGFDSSSTPGAGGLVFGGTGLARVTAGGNVDLANSGGLTFVYDPSSTASSINVTAGNKGGLLEIGVGGNVNMTQSTIATLNGAHIFMHGLAAQAPVAGTTATATSATVGVVTVNGQSVLAIGGVPVIGRDGVTPVPSEGNQSLIGRSVYVAGGWAVLDIAGLPVAVGANDTIVGQSVLLIAGNVVLGVNGKPIVVNPSTGSVVSAGDLVHGTAVLDRPLAQLTDGTIVAVINGKTVFATPSGAAAVNGRPSVNNGAVTLLVDGRQVNVVEPVGGSVNVGANSAVNRGNGLLPTGILTQRGGAIDVKATGNVDVNRSRIATFGGGAITITSTTGDINAGSGARGDVTNFVISQQGPNNTTINTFYPVPGSGIFTFHPLDGNLPDIPKFNPISPLQAEVIMHQFLGHDVSRLEPLIPAAQEAWKNQYEQSVRQLFAGFRLGDVRLTAAHDVIVPPAGIRGRNVTINAGHNLELQGGEIRGISTVNVGSQVVGSLTGFVGVFAVNLGGVSGGSGTTLGLGSITGNVGSVTTTPTVTASASTASLTSSKATDDATSSQPVNNPKNVSGRTDKKGSLAAAGSLRIRDKVKIKVETKPEQAM